MQKTKVTGLVADMWTHIRVLQISGHWLLGINKSSNATWNYMRVGGTTIQTILLVVNYVFMIINCTQQTADSDEFTSNVATILFFTHCIFKLFYCALRRRKFYRTLNSWNNTNSHPLFAESSARHHSNANSSMKRLLTIILTCTLLSVFAWTTITFFGESIIHVKDPENENNTLIEEVPRLLIRAWYPWDTSGSMSYVVTFVYQFFWLASMLVSCNLLDTLFCCWLIYACEQLVHLKEIMKPLMEISHSLDSFVAQPADLFRAASSSSHAALLSGSADGLDVRGIYNSATEYSGFRQGTGTLATVQGSSVGPNGLTKKQDLMIRSAIKYWVERHKQVVRYVNDIGDTYGGALLAHMLISTVELTLLAYLATTVTGVNPRGMCIIGYVIYSFGQVFQFCYYGNQLIEESSSVLEAAYSCRWYDGTDEAKAFVQIICQQCQKSMAISGAKFFTVSLDLFASILGAVVTYFLLLIQLN